MGGQRNQRRGRHGAGADRVDIVEMGALELDIGGCQAQRLVDEQIGRDGAEPGHGDDGENAECFLKQLVDAQLHQEKPRSPR